ncbi:MAG: IS1595 family transposase [Chloroflexi bacterium]|nr:IS1595 family transposase [Chloroflexota bacterium]
MNLLQIAARFRSQEACIAHLESVRWPDRANCPHCGSLNVARKAENDRIGRWNCHDCKSSFNVMSGTIFAKTKIPLRNWFMALSLMVNAKKSLSSHQLARDLGMNQGSAHYMQQRIRAEMTNKQGEILLHGIIEADETYVGGKPRKRNKRDDDEPKAPRGRATKKTPVIGAVERGGKVVAQVAGDLTGRGVMRFLRKAVDPTGSLLITDEYRAYRAVRSSIPHEVIKHSEQYVDGSIHTNTIEGFWSLLKRAWYGQHHQYRKHYMPLYVGEACWKYNERNNAGAFGTFLRGCFA